MPKQFTPLIQCPECKGTGKRKLPSHLAAALREVRRKPGTCHQIWERLKDGVSITGVQNRLTDLVALGLVERSKEESSSFTYTPTVAKKP